MNYLSSDKNESDIITVLNLESNDLNDLNFINEFDDKFNNNIKEIYLNDNNIDLFENLKYFKNLEVIDISGNGEIFDIEIFTNLKKISQLYLSQTYIDKNQNKYINDNIDDDNIDDDLFYLKYFKNIPLQILNADSTYIEHIGKNIQYLDNLIELSLSLNDISSLVNLKFNLKLVKLNLNSNIIKSITGIENLINLSQLILSNNEIDDEGLVGIENLFNLTYLNLNENKITNNGIKLIKDLYNLEKLDISYNNINDISELFNLINLKELYICRNNITNISVLTNFKKLKIFNGSNNLIHDINPLNDLVEITNLDLNNNQIYDINSLKKIIKLKHLEISYNKILDISVIINFEKLLRLDLSYNNILDISIFKYFNNKYNKYSNKSNIPIIFEYLNLSGNPFTDITPLNYISTLIVSLQDINFNLSHLKQTNHYHNIIISYYILIFHSKLFNNNYKFLNICNIDNEFKKMLYESYSKDEKKQLMNEFNIGCKIKIIEY